MKALIRRLTRDGSVLLGNTKRFRLPVKLSREQLLGHVVVERCAAEAHSPVAKNIAAAGIRQGSGVLWMSDGRDFGTYAAIREFARLAGREHEVHLINLSGQSPAESPDLAGTTLNPFANEDLKSSIALVMGLVDFSFEHGADWQERCSLLVTAVMSVLVHARDNGGIPVNAALILEMLDLGTLSEICHGTMLPKLPAEVRMKVMEYLAALPAFELSKGDEQSAVTVDQHRYAEQLIGGALRMIASVPELGSETPDLDLGKLVSGKEISFVMVPEVQSTDKTSQVLPRFILGHLAPLLAQGKTAADGPDGPPFLAVVNSAQNLDAVLSKEFASKASSSGLAVVACYSGKCGNEALSDAARITVAQEGRDALVSIPAGRIVADVELSIRAV